MTVDKWDRRALCDDGACVGVIGQDGTCKTCGKLSAEFVGDLRKPGRVSSKSDVEEETTDDEVEQPTSPSKLVAAATKVSAWNERKLCPDGACVGLIGDDGTCKVCGKSADGIEAKGTDDDEDDDEESEDDDSDDSDDSDDDEDDDETSASDDDETDDDESDEDESDDDESDDDESDDDESDDRKLCSDGACTGVIGDNGTCKICGKAPA